MTETQDKVAFSDAAEHPGDTTPHPSFGTSAFLATVMIVIAADVCLFRAKGMTGPAVFFLLMLPCCWFGLRKKRVTTAAIVVSLLIVALSVRLAWHGTWLNVVVGVWLVTAVAVAFRGILPYVPETFVYAADCVPGGYQVLLDRARRLRDRGFTRLSQGDGARWIGFVLPAIVASVFSFIFVMANPDVVKWVSAEIGHLVLAFRDSFLQFNLVEVLFCCWVAWLACGLLRPTIRTFSEDDHRLLQAEAQDALSASLYAAFRNTLVTVICLFAVYLAFEFRTLWFREFPEGFYYSGYAHEGAAWLTVALALATFLLSAMFRRRLLRDDRVVTLLRLAWCWSALNLLLAIAVYNRLLIYISFNGMTRMRTVGLLGISSVVAGFLLVLRKINRGLSFVWLLRRQLWIVAFALYLYQVTPVDLVVHSYNVSQVMAGHTAPVVQITGHPTDDEVLPLLVPLCDHSDPLIRDGLRAMVTLRHRQLQRLQKHQQASGWTARQWATEWAIRKLNSSRSHWQSTASPEEMKAAWRRLQEEAFRRWW